MSGLTTLEQEIMDLWDRGCSITQIDQRSRHNIKTIKSVVSRLHVTGREEQLERVATTEQDGNFMAAMRKFHPAQVVS